jgi:hypothetical protein
MDRLLAVRSAWQAVEKNHGARTSISEKVRPSKS